jgi:hypothetical protein
MKIDIETLVDQFNSLPTLDRAAFTQAARDMKEDQKNLRDLPDHEVAAVILHVLNQPDGVATDEFESKVVSYFVDQSLKRLLAEGKIVMRRDSNGNERYFAVEP